MLNTSIRVLVAGLLGNRAKQASFAYKFTTVLVIKNRKNTSFSTQKVDLGTNDPSRIAGCLIAIMRSASFEKNEKLFCDL